MGGDNENNEIMRYSTAFIRVDLNFLKHKIISNKAETKRQKIAVR
jgi:hypothetical protein